MEIKVFYCNHPEEKSILSNSNKYRFNTESPQKLTKSVLDYKLNLITDIVHSASKNDNKEAIPIVFGPEDFFESAEISDIEGSFKEGSGKCFHLETTYSFFAKEMLELSRKHPKVLIAPGSMYVSTKMEGSLHRYDQEGQIIKTTSICVQNIAPVFYNGQLIRIIKKGTTLKTNDKGKKKDLYTYEDVCKINRNTKIQVEKYREDDLTDINPGLVFFGETTLPGERNLLNTLDLFSNEIHTPTFKIKDITFGLEICADHSDKKLFNKVGDNQIHVHLVSSNGIGPSYDATKGKGYCIQSDADTNGYLNSIKEPGKERSIITEFPYKSKHMAVKTDKKPSVSDNRYTLSNTKSQEKGMEYKYDTTNKHDNRNA